RAYNVASRSYESTDRTVMYAADSSWTTDNVDFEAADYGMLRCQLGGTTTSDCSTPGTVGTSVGVAFAQQYSIAGALDPITSIANVPQSFLADRPLFAPADPGLRCDYTLDLWHPIVP